MALLPSFLSNTNTFFGSTVLRGPGRLPPLKPIPGPSIPLVNAAGLITPPWFEYFKGRELIGFGHLTDVSTTVPVNGETPIYNSSTGKWTPGAN